jgi:hypothetical protein
MQEQKKATNDTLPCVLCKQPLAARTDKNGKPYFVCDECGTQFFIRRATGAARLAALLQAPSSKPGVLTIPQKTRKAVCAELDLIDDGSELAGEAEKIFAPGSDTNALPIPEWIQQRTARVRTLLGL